MSSEEKNKVFKPKTYFTARLIMTVWYWHNDKKNRSMEKNRIQKYTHIFIDK